MLTTPHSPLLAAPWAFNVGESQGSALDLLFSVYICSLGDVIQCHAVNTFYVPITPKLPSAQTSELQACWSNCFPCNSARCLVGILNLTNPKWIFWYFPSNFFWHLHNLNSLFQLPRPNSGALLDVSFFHFYIQSVVSRIALLIKYSWNLTSSHHLHCSALGLAIRIFHRDYSYSLSALALQLPTVYSPNSVEVIL